jgi:hypothetical protein
VDRLWPRGLGKVQLALDRGAKEFGPSSSLRSWYGHDPARFEDFQRWCRRPEHGKAFPRTYPPQRPDAQTPATHGQYCRRCNPTQGRRCRWEALASLRVVNAWSTSEVVQEQLGFLANFRPARASNGATRTSTTWTKRPSSTEPVSANQHSTDQSTPTSRIFNTSAPARVGGRVRFPSGSAIPSELGKG